MPTPLARSKLALDPEEYGLDELLEGLILLYIENLEEIMSAYFPEENAQQSNSSSGQNPGFFAKVGSFFSGIFSPGSTSGSTSGEGEQPGFFTRVWESISGFFGGLFGSSKNESTA